MGWFALLLRACFVVYMGLGFLIGFGCCRFGVLRSGWVCFVFACFDCLFCWWFVCVWLGVVICCFGICFWCFGVVGCCLFLYVCCFVACRLRGFVGGCAAIFWTFGAFYFILLWFVLSVLRFRLLGFVSMVVVLLCLRG